MNKIWSDEQKQFIRDYANVFNDVKLTQELNSKFNTNFSVAATRKQRQRLNIIKEAHRSYFRIKSSNETVA